MVVPTWSQSHTYGVTVAMHHATHDANIAVVLCRQQPSFSATTCVDAFPRACINPGHQGRCQRVPQVVRMAALPELWMARHRYEHAAMVPSKPLEAS